VLLEADPLRAAGALGDPVDRGLGQRPQLAGATGEIPDVAGQRHRLVGHRARSVDVDDLVEQRHPDAAGGRDRVAAGELLGGA
jgi:hypothetical protein